jgi:hypothetical protein
MPVLNHALPRRWEPPGRGVSDRALRDPALVSVETVSAETPPLRPRLLFSRLSLTRFVTQLLSQFHHWLSARQDVAIARCAELRLTLCPVRAPQATPWRKR